MIMADSEVAEGVGVATLSGNLGQIIQSAMDQAVLDCLEQGISDPEIHLAAKMEARARAKADYKAAEQAALEAAVSEQ